MRKLLTKFVRDVLMSLIEDGEVVFLCQKNFTSMRVGDRERAQQFMDVCVQYVALNYKAFNTVVDNRMNVTQAYA